MVEQIDEQNKAIRLIWTTDDVKTAIKDMAENGWEFRPSLSEDQMFWALRLASVAEPEIPLDEKKIIAALERLYRDRLIQTDGEGQPVNQEGSAASKRGFCRISSKKMYTFCDRRNFYG